MKYYLTAFISLFSFSLISQVSTTYTISFENAIHHEARIEAIYRNIKSDTATFRMSRTSPGRYALHEFVKNVYSVEVFNKDGEPLKVLRTDPYSWHVIDHDGEVRVNYTLYANHGDGTYAQIDETHAHLNIPATFMFMEGLEDEKIEVKFVPRSELNWKIATQLKPIGEHTYEAENLYYFMDSPTELSNFRINSFKVGDQSIEIVLHDHLASDEDFKTYTSYVEKIVYQQMAVFGELPKFDFGRYTFLACFMPQATGDAMEHRNSTYMTSTRSLANAGETGNLGSAAHEFFHCWNVERIRPKSLEPFDFKNADMSGELWFAEGFTNYYTSLSMLRAGAMDRDQYLKSRERVFNFVWTSPGRNYFNPIEMSYQAPFVDAAKSVDETNRGNTFISYYSYGDMLGLALDLSLRTIDKNLDDYMKMVWNSYGKNEIPYTIDDLHKVLREYTDKGFADAYFKNYIYDSQLPEFKPLFENVGIEFQIQEELGLGASLKQNVIFNEPKVGSSFYSAGLSKDDKIISAEGLEIEGIDELKNLLKSKSAGDSIELTIERLGKTLKKQLILTNDISYNFSFIPDEKLTPTQKRNKESWLSKKE